MGRSQLWIGISFLVLLEGCLGLKIHLDPSQHRCVGQELDTEDSAIFYVNPNHIHENSAIQLVAVTITDPSGGYLLEDNINTGESREISKNIAISGVYQMCFLNTGQVPVAVTFYINFKNRDVKHLKREHDKNLPVVERRLAWTEVLLEDIIKEIDFAKRQEEVLKEAIETTNNRIEWFSYFSMVILISTAIFQLIYLRNFFTSKKFV